MRHFFKRNYCVIFAIAFLIPIIIVGIAFCETVKYEQILKTGIETTAYIDDDSFSSNTTVMNDSLYSVEYYYEDEYGNIYRGRTSKSYRYHQVMKMIDKKTILIKYDPKTFDSVEASYDSPFDMGDAYLLILFVLLDLGGWIVAARHGINNIRIENARINGILYKATVISFGTNLKVNDRELYRVQYTWNDYEGVRREVYSPSMYSYEEALYLKELGTIEISAIGKYSAIMTQIPDTHNE